MRPTSCSSGDERVVFLSGGALPGPLAQAIEAEGFVVRILPERSGGTHEAATGVLLSFGSGGWTHAEGPGRGGLVSVAVGGPENGGLRIDPAGDTADSISVIRLAFTHSEALAAARHAEDELRRSRDEMRSLNRIGMALMTERDLDRLLGKIVDAAIELTGSDAASLYLLESGTSEHPHLRFVQARNLTLPDFEPGADVVPLDTGSIAGYVGLTGETLRIDDVHALPEGVPYRFNGSFDERHGYRTRSVLAAPMQDNVGATVGVLQLINRKRSRDAEVRTQAHADAEVVRFETRHEELVRSLAAQAAVAVENARLHGEIEHLFESFVTASVSAVEERDPTTAGHSVRVAALCTRMAELLPRLDSGRHAGTRLSVRQLKELRYAALLHDFGKIAVREEVLVKAKKLPPVLQERVEARFDLIRRTAENEAYRAALEDAARGRPAGIEKIRPELERRLAEIDEMHEVVRRSNEPSVLPQETEVRLDEIAGLTFRAPGGARVPYLTEEEYRFLRIPKGTLDEKERGEIESHVERTYRFLSRIPWTAGLRDVAEIAYGHHEKLDGRGYPRGIRGEGIPVQTRIMTIADIFDALTASDRPYKRAVPLERAIDILRKEAADGMLDAELVDFFVDSRAYRIVQDRDWRELAHPGAR